MNEKTNPNEGAFATSNDKHHQSGCSKREYFAAMAMQGLLANPREVVFDGIKTTSISAMSVAISDALIKALNE